MKLQVKLHMTGMSKTETARIETEFRDAVLDFASNLCALQRSIERRDEDFRSALRVGFDAARRACRRPLTGVTVDMVVS